MPHHHASADRSARYVAQSTTFRFGENLDPGVRLDLDHTTSKSYTIGALLCERALRLGGTELLFRMLGSGDDAHGPWRGLKMIGIEPSNIEAELRAELQRPIFAVP